MLFRLFSLEPVARFAAAALAQATLAMTAMAVSALAGARWSW